MMPSDVKSLLTGTPTVNKALQVLAYSRIRVRETGATVLLLTPQATVYALRLVQDCYENARNKANVVAIITPVNSGIAEKLAIEEDRRYQDLPVSGDPGDESPQTWGSLGDIEFDLIGSPTSFSGKDAMTYTQHDIIGAKPRLQYTATKLQTLTLKVAWYSKIVETGGVEKRFNDLLEAMRQRKVLDLIVGDYTVGSTYAGKYVITGIDHTVAKHNSNGSINAMEVTIQLLEWVEAPDLVTTEREKPKGTTQNQKPTPQQSANITRDASGAYYQDGKRMGTDKPA